MTERMNPGWTGRKNGRVRARMNTKKTWNWKIAIAAVVLAAAFAGMYLIFGPKAVQGAKTVTVEVVDDTGNRTEYEVHTDAQYLRQVLEEAEGLEVTGQESEYGLMIETVNGVTAVYDTDGAYWAVYVNGEYGSYGVDAQPVEDQDRYRLEYTVD